MTNLDDHNFTPYQKLVVDGLLRNQESMLKILEAHKEIIKTQNRTIGEMITKMKKLENNFEISYN